MSKVFIVFGGTGEYSGGYEWAVCAYANEERAKTHVIAAIARAKEYEATMLTQHYEGWEAQRAIRGGWMPDLDPNFTMDYTGTEYWYLETELKP